MENGALLDAREEQAYRLLVGLSAARPSELAEVAELPQHEADEVLQRLHAKGLVTVQHADTGWDHYADAWEVLAPDGTVLGTRTLLHPHTDEQPFT